MNHRARIILVEANRPLRRYITELLRPHGISVLSYDDRWKAFRRIKKRREFDAVLIDKDLAGIGVLRTLFANMLRDLDTSMKFVVLVDSPETLDSRPFDEHGYENLLPKARIPKRLPSLLKRLVGIKTGRTTRRRRVAASCASG